MSLLLYQSNQLPTAYWTAFKFGVSLPIAYGPKFSAISIRPLTKENK
jgi:hypothetical protein